MLGQQVMPSYLQGKKATDNPVNQQGRIVQIARLAGIFDCEGCFYLNRYGRSHDCYSVVARVSNSNMRIIEEVCSTLSVLGFKYNRTDGLPTGMGGRVSEIRLHGTKRAKPLIELIAPYLSAKSRVTDLLKMFWERRDSVAYGASYTEEDFRIHRAVRAVNSNGTAKDIPVGDHLELVGPSRVARLGEVEAKAKLAAIVECDGSLGLTNLRNGENYMPAIYMVNTNESLLAEIRQSLAMLGIPYYFQMRPPRGISIKAIGEFHIQGMKRAKRFLDAIGDYFVAYAERAKLIRQFINRRLSLPANYPYSEVEREIKRALDEEKPKSDSLQRLHAEPGKSRMIQSVLHGDMQTAAEMTAALA